MTSKVKISFVLPLGLQKEFKERILKDGYDLKGKSRWVSESIEKLLNMKNYPDLVKINDEMKGFEKLESVVVLKDLKMQLDAAIVTVRKFYPAIEGVQSRILRTAIVQRLLLE
jgi:hypothetical protein